MADGVALQDIDGDVSAVRHCRREPRQAQPVFRGDAGARPVGHGAAPDAERPGNLGSAPQASYDLCSSHVELMPDNLATVNKNDSEPIWQDGLRLFWQAGADA